MKNKTLTLFFTLLFFLFASNKAYAEEISSFEYVVDPYVEYSYEMMLEDANTLQTKYPDLIRLKSIGTSVEGRDLLLIEFGNGNRKIFLNGATHAREYITTTYLMYMIDRYAYAYTSGQPFEGHDLQAILSGVTFSIVPMVNPDGVNLVQNGIDSVRDKDTFSKFKINKGDSHGYLSWKANINGVDLNRNYPDNWNVKTAVTEPSSSNFKGVSPLSEPESRALATYLNQNMCWAYLTVHSQGAGFYGWNDPNSAYYPQLTEMVSRFAEKSGFKKLSGGSGTSYGNFANYVRETYLKPTFTIELCNYVGSYPYPDQDFDKVFAPVKTLSLIVAEEVIKMSNQNYLVFQNETFLHAFSDETYAARFAQKWANAKILHVVGGNTTLKSLAPTAVTVALADKNEILKGYAIDGSPFVKLRDFALVAAGTEKRFNIDYDKAQKAILLTSGGFYSAVESSPMTAVNRKTEAVIPAIETLFLDGEPVSIKSFKIGGSNYFHLEELIAALDLSEICGIVSIK